MQYKYFGFRLFELNNSNSCINYNYYIDNDFEIWKP